METPNNNAGKATELVMNKISSYLRTDNPNENVYNRVYEHVYDTITTLFESEDVT